MRVLLTGASGFLGSYVLERLHRQGIDTVMLGRRRIFSGAPSHFIEADLLASPDLILLLKESAATHLLHLAWYAEHGQFWASPLNLRWVEATTHLVEAFCERGGQQVVVAGTCAEYDWSYGYCREDITPLSPTTLYGTAKDAARRLVMAVCAQHQVPCAWGRVFLPFGTGENHRRLIPSLIEVFRGTRPPFAVNESAYRDFLHASDIADGFTTLLQHGGSGVYNISSGQPVRVGTIVQEIAQMLNADPQAVLGMNAMHSGEPPLLVGENLKLKTLGWQPEFSLAQWLERTVHEALA